MSRTNVFRFLLVTLLLVGSLGCEQIEQPDPLPALITIRDATPGTEMTVDGAISVAPGTFESSTEDIGFAIQDLTGAIYVQVDPVLGFLGLDINNLTLSKSVRVRGIVGELNQMITLMIDETADVTINGSGVLYFPQDLQTAEVDQTATALERESKIVKLSGNIQLDPAGSGEIVVRDESPSGDLYGWKIWIDDNSGLAQTFWHPTANIDPEVLTFLSADSPLEVVGFLNRTDDTFEVFPRGNFDISLPIPNARIMPLGEQTLVRGVIGLAPFALAPMGQYGFSLHEEDGSGIFVSITDPEFDWRDIDDEPVPTEIVANKVYLNTYYPNLYPPIRVHIAGELVATTGGDRVIVPETGGVRLISANLAFPSSVTAIGRITAADLGRVVSASGILQPPPSGNPYPGGAAGWTVVPGGYRARITVGTGLVNVFLPTPVIGVDLDGDTDYDLQDLFSYPIGINIGDSLSVTGFLRHFDGDYEIVILRNLAAYID